MIETDPRTRGAPLTHRAVFGPLARADFAASYPEGPHKLTHELGDHPLLAIDALAALGEALPAASVEYNRGDLPVGIAGKPGSNGLTIGQTIRDIATSNSWAALKNIEQSPTYAGLLHDILGELKPIVERRTGRMLKPQGFIFISSPDAVTPYHFDPEHNILLQLRGTKVMTVFPAGANDYAPDRIHESYHRGGGRELTWQESFRRNGMPFKLEPGDAMFVPVMAPHFVNNGPEVSISLSVTWRSEWSFAEADARAFNGLLRKWGFNPKPPGRWPARNRLKALSWRLLRRWPGI
jgi:hypothetical protein